MPMNMPPRPAGEMPKTAGSPMAMKAGLTLLAGLLVGFVVGYGAGRVSTGAPASPLAGGKGGSYQEGYDAARKKVMESGIFPQAPTELTSISGSIESVGDGSFVMVSGFRNPNPLDETVYPEKRTVEVGAETKIYRRQSRDPADMQKEFEAFQKALAAGRTDVVPPQPFTQVDVKLADLKAGDNVTVNAAENILFLAAFTATEVAVQPGSNAPGAPPSGRQTP